VDVVFNFDCLGFTGTPFIDNYPTFAYINQRKEGPIPDLIDRSFYVHTYERVPQTLFEERFAQFQGQNSNVLLEFAASGFVQTAGDESEVNRIAFQMDGLKAPK
jgi:hypothetical protein